MKTQTIPVVDLSWFQDPLKRSELISQIGTAFHEVGFVAIENHGVDAALIARAYECSSVFFQLPLDDKKKYEDALAFEPRSFSQMGREHVKGMKAPDLKEFWHTGRESFEDSLNKSKYPQNTWPEEVEAFRDVMVELYDQLEECACHVLEASAIHLGLLPNTMCDMITDGNSVLRLAHYPPVAPDTDPAVFRSAPHEDIDFITLLCESTGEGLEILKKDGSWLPVHAIQGQIIVNVGDMLQNLSNGYYKSTTHRVSNNNLDRNRRLSMPFFVHPRPEVKLGPVTEGEPRYPNITAGEYFSQRLTEIGFGHSKR